VGMIVLPRACFAWSVKDEFDGWTTTTMTTFTHFDVVVKAF
jgi:hypothetical protein